MSRVFTFQYDADQIYLIMEFCKVGDLSSHIASHGKLQESAVKDLVQQLALALRYMNKKKVFSSVFDCVLKGIHKCRLYPQ